ncbi:uncharacterized protein LOC123516248 [Portunus trituberculatus]|uniref:uncharacterized protein LOC123516248 n=1 Tax=Portunus trituberculatus TaxID=210409 RepID=UPI001E1CCB43|nr:uncharacterized protein LOC123516248 [Portunus trituberculatus]
MADTLDSRGTLTLYKAQIRPYMEYGALSWMSSAAVHMQRLDAVQRRALRLVTTEEEEQHPAPLTSRDVSVLVVCHKTQVQRVSHLNPLRLQPHTAQRCTKDAARSDEVVQVPRSRSSQHQRTYTARTSRLWNIFVAATPQVRSITTQQVKVAVHKWRGRHPSRLVLQ